MKKMILVLSLLLISLPILAAQFDGSVTEWKKSEKQDGKFSKPEESFHQALRLVREKYVDRDVTDEDLYRAATAGMLASLNTDKTHWNALIAPSEMEDMKIETTGHLAGLGVVLDFEQATHHARVRDLIPDSAGEKGGVKIGDEILEVDGHREESLQAIAALIRGPVGKRVVLKLLRDDRILDLEIKRAEVVLPNVSVGEVDSRISYLAIEGFTDKTVADVKARLQNIKTDKLILDLRGNQGGLFDGGVGVADLFLNKDQIAVRTTARDGADIEYKSPGPAWRPEARLIVLTDDKTASSAEFLAASLKENRHAILMGAKTSGKWTAESIESLPNGYSIKYSMFRLSTASGASYQGTGLVPDFELAPSKTGTVYERDLSKRVNDDAVLKAAVMEAHLIGS